MPIQNQSLRLRDIGFAVKRTLSKLDYTVKCVELKLPRITMISAGDTNLTEESNLAEETHLEEDDSCMILNVASEF